MGYEEPAPGVNVQPSGSKQNQCLHKPLLVTPRVPSPTFTWTTAASLRVPSEDRRSLSPMPVRAQAWAPHASILRPARASAPSPIRHSARVATHVPMSSPTSQDLAAPFSGRIGVHVGTVSGVQTIVNPPSARSAPLAEGNVPMAGMFTRAPSRSERVVNAHHGSGPDLITSLKKSRTVGPLLSFGTGSLPRDVSPRLQVGVSPQQAVVAGP